MENNIINNQNSPIKSEKEIKTEYNNNIMTPDDKAKIHISNSNKLVPNKLNLNFNSKYDDALLEELYNSRDKSWRNEISSASPYEDNKSKKKKYFSNQNIFLERGNNMNNNINNNINKNEPVKLENTSKEKKDEDRFKDFDDILNLEEPKVKKRKYSSEQKIISFEKYIKNSKSENNNKSFNDQKRKDSNITNLDVIKEVLEKDEKNKADQIQEYKDKNKLYINIDKNDDKLRNKNNFGDNVNKKINFDNIDNSNNFLMNDNKKNYFNSNRTRNSKNNNNDFNNNYLNENTNTSNENNINKYTGINLEYSEDRRSNDEKFDNVKEEKDENNINDKTDNNNNFDKNNDIQNISNHDKLEDNSIKNNKNIHYIDSVKTPSEKKVNESYKDTIMKTLLKSRVRNEEISERIRLLYVAVTRAKEKMIFVLPEQEEEREVLDIVPLYEREKYNSFLSIMKSIYSSLLPYIVKKDIVGSKAYLSNIKKESNNLVLADDNLIVKEISISSNEVLEKHYSKDSLHIITREEQELMNFGTKVHAILEEIDFNNYNLECYNISDSMKSKINNFVNSDFMRDKLQLKMYKEYEFLYEEDNSISHGIIDLLIEDINTMYIVDYKLKNINDDNYDKQLNGYRDYIKNVTGKDVRCFLYSIMDGVYREVIND